MTDVSIIIPTLNPDSDLAWTENIDSSIEYEILLCEDESASKARNAGVSAAESDKLVFLDDDSHPRCGYFKRVIDILNKYPAVTGKVVDTGCKYTSAFVNNYNQSNEMQKTKKVIGCNMAVKSDVFDTVGGFDERLPYGHEERELADRIVEEYEIIYDPELVVEHPFADSVVDYWKKSYRHGREEITYWEINDENIKEKVFYDLLTPYGYIHSSIRDSIISSVAEVTKHIGMLRGYADYLFRTQSSRF